MGARSTVVGRLVVAALVVLAILAGASRSSAGEATQAEGCPPPGGKLFCVTIADTDSVSRSSAGSSTYMEYVVRVDNLDSSTLTHGSATLTLTDIVGTTPNDPSATDAVLDSLTSAPSPDACREITSTQLRCDFGSLASGAFFEARLVYRTAGNPAVSGTRLAAVVSFDAQTKSPGEPADPTRAVRSAENTTLYEESATGGATFVPAGRPVDVNLTTTFSSLSFTSPGSRSFFARIRDADDDVEHCFAAYACGVQVTNTDVADVFDANRPLQWTRRIASPPKGVNASNIVAIHFFDPVPATADPATDTFTAPKSLVDIDGARVSVGTGGELPSPLVAGTDYFVVNATDRSFQLASSRKGKPIDVTTSGSGVLVERIRVIGDTKTERWTSCTTPPPSRIPSIFATKVGQTVIDTCVWDSENGWMK